MADEPLVYDELTEQQRFALANLARHPGFDVLVLIFNKSCERINGRLVKLNPEDPEYEKKLSRLHLCSRTVNEFCSSVLKCVALQERIAVLSQHVTEQEIKSALDSAEKKMKPGNPLAFAMKSNEGD